MKFKKDDKIKKDGDVVEHESAGGFLFFNSTSDGLLVALLKKIDDDYYMPKGHLKKGEIPEDAAVREIMEELSLQVVPQNLGKVCVDSYEFTLPNDDNKHAKIVHVYAFEAKEKIEIFPLEDENFEIARWVDVKEAMEILAFDADNLEKAVKKYQEVKNK